MRGELCVQGYREYSSARASRLQTNFSGTAALENGWLATMWAMEFQAPEGIAFADEATAVSALAALPESVARWFTEHVGQPTKAQQLAWPVFAAGHNLLLSAPTGTGKTLAAFLPILGRLFSDLSKPPSPWSTLTRG